VTATGSPASSTDSVPEMGNPASWTALVIISIVEVLRKNPQESSPCSGGKRAPVDWLCLNQDASGACCVSALAGDAVTVSVQPMGVGAAHPYGAVDVFTVDVGRIGRNARLIPVGTS
jgi:hypothetical protein